MANRDRDQFTFPPRRGTRMLDSSPVEGSGRRSRGDCASRRPGTGRARIACEATGGGGRVRPPERARTITAEGEREVEAALAELRTRYRDAADAEIAAAVAELAALEARAGEPSAAGPAFDAGVAAVVEAVLGEREA
jgi:hypothetical protein